MKKFKLLLLLVFYGLGTFVFLLVSMDWYLGSCIEIMGGSLKSGCFLHEILEFLCYYNSLYHDTFIACFLWLLVTIIVLFSPVILACIFGLRFDIMLRKYKEFEKSRKELLESEKLSGGDLGEIKEYQGSYGTNEESKQSMHESVMDHNQNQTETRISPEIIEKSLQEMRCKGRRKI